MWTQWGLNRGLPTVLGFIRGTPLSYWGLGFGGSGAYQPRNQNTLLLFIVQDAKSGEKNLRGKLASKDINVNAVDLISRIEIESNVFEVPLQTVHFEPRKIRFHFSLHQSHQDSHSLHFFPCLIVSVIYFLFPQFSRVVYSLAALSACLYSSLGSVISAAFLKEHKLSSSRCGTCCPLNP
jgi:hypothetical protein